MPPHGTVGDDVFDSLLIVIKTNTSLEDEGLELIKSNRLPYVIIRIGNDRQNRPENLFAHYFDIRRRIENYLWSKAFSSSNRTDLPKIETPL